MKIDFERVSAEIVDVVERRRRCQKAQVIRAFRQEPIDEGVIDAIGRKDRFRNSLRRVLVEIESRGAEGEVEIGHHRVEHQVARNGKGNVVGDGRGADAAFGADDRDDATDGLGVRGREQTTHGAHDLKRADRRNQIIADAASHQLAIERYIIHPPDDDDARGGVTHRRQLIEPAEDVFVAALRLEDNDIRRRRVLIGLDRGDQAAHLNAQVRSGHPAIFAGRLDRGRGLNGFAERLHRNARRRRDTLVAPGNLGGRIFNYGLAR